MGIYMQCGSDFWGRTYFSICNFFAPHQRDSGVMDNSKSVRTFDMLVVCSTVTLAYALAQLLNYIGVRFIPTFLIPGIFPQLPVFEGMYCFFIKHGHGPFKKKLVQVTKSWLSSRGYKASTVWTCASYNGFSRHRSRLSLIQMHMLSNGFNLVVILAGIQLQGWSINPWEQSFHPRCWRNLHWYAHTWKPCIRFKAVQPWRWGKRVSF